MTWKSRILFTALLLIPATGWTESSTLYSRIGGMPVIQQLLDDFTTRMIADERLYLVARVLDTPQRKSDYKTHIAAHVCNASGGPCRIPVRAIVTLRFNSAGQRAVLDHLTAADPRTQSVRAVRQTAGDRREHARRQRPTHENELVRGPRRPARPWNRARPNRPPTIAVLPVIPMTVADERADSHECRLFAAIG